MSLLDSHRNLMVKEYILEELRSLYEEQKSLKMGGEQ